MQNVVPLAVKRSGPLSLCVFATSELLEHRGVPPGVLVCELRYGAALRLRYRGYDLTCSPAPADMFSGKWWWTRGGRKVVDPNAKWSTWDDTQTTEAIFSSLADGSWVEAMDGPFETEGDAHYALDLAWESPKAIDHEDDDD